ncbi:hypothetical protein NIT60_13010 [Mammaliicoccus sciuri]|nr:hypothetical protein NIT60_13010 [Mammaliicoccus sciuri]
MGDTADGYPGVKGIGEKTAIKLIQQYQSVENVLENINELTVGQQKKIITYRDDLANVETTCANSYRCAIRNRRFT